VDVTRWNTPGAFFPWNHVQQYIDSIDSTVYHLAIEFAQGQFVSLAKPCPQCGTAPAELFWLNGADPEAAWDAQIGRVGFLTVCKKCKRQVDFLIDRELTEMQAEQWRACRTLS
jgi:hypothetical protein